MTRTTDNQPNNTTRWITTLLAAQPILHQQAQDWTEGFPVNTSPAAGTGNPKGGHSDRVANEATRGHDETQPPPRSGHGLADQCTQTANNIHQWLREGQRITTQALRLLPLGHPAAEMLARHAEARFNGAGECQACADWIEGVTRRLRRGLCPACHQRWLRANKPDIHQWASGEWHRRGLCGQRECRHTNGDTETAGPCATNHNDVTSDATGGALRPEPGAA